MRFNLKRGGSEDIKNLTELSNRLFHKYNWHTELYVDSKNLKELDPIPVLKKINEINPSGLMFGTDLSSTRAKTPFTVKDIELIKENFTALEQQNIFHKNAITFYSNSC